MLKLHYWKPVIRYHCSNALISVYSSTDTIKFSINCRKYFSFLFSWFRQNICSAECNVSSWPSVFKQPASCVQRTSSTTFAYRRCQHFRNAEFNLLNPTGYVMHQLTFNNCTLCPHRIYVFCIYLRTNSDLCHLQHKLIGFYNQMKSVYSAVRTGSLNKAVCGSSVKG